MKRLLFAAALLATTAPALSGDLGVSVSIGQPGFYGRIDVGGYPPPRLVFPQPVIVERAPVRYAPIYLHVPPGHARRWDRHCHRYGACGQPVYFVQNDWYQRDFVPYHQDRHHRRHEAFRDQSRRHFHGNHDHENDRRGHYRNDGEHGWRGAWR